jgi:putative drug exporter of the RND superfamily
LFFAFAALSAGPETDLKVMATALGAGILLDATVVRALLVPALTAVLGPANWWLPRPARRLLRIPAPPAPGEPAPMAHTAGPARPGE